MGKRCAALAGGTPTHEDDVALACGCGRFTLQDMRVLQVHNTYQQPGGEDTVAEREAALLRAAGHTVIEYRRSNQEIAEFNLWQKLALPKRMIWAGDARRDLRRILRQERPDVAHFHNTFLMISPAAYAVCRELGVPVVQSLHNPRLLCPSANFYRNGTVCQDCVAKTPPWPGIVHGCYRQSRVQTALVAGMLTAHRLLRTWHRQVNAFVVFTNFYRQQFIAGGLPAEKIFVKPHFVEPDPGVRPAGQSGRYALFVGRLDPEKGVRTMLRAWRDVTGLPLKIRGDGQLRGEVERAIREHPAGAMELAARLSGSELVRLIKGAAFLVWPSEGYYETFGLVAIEAFACGVPVIASNVGVGAEIVRDGRTGLHFAAGDPKDLAAKVAWALAHPTELLAMGRRARAEFEARYTASKNLKILISIYERCLAEQGHRRDARG
ncbi:MAG: glycosyltransferase family 4 protein [Verrucomicrobiae bacterium]|nr:glycosyltransferase family 4 protein [Verrucomicrobiae bacterium]